MTKKEIKKELAIMKDNLQKVEINFSMINSLKGNKELLDRAFKETKTQLLNG